MGSVGELVCAVEEGQGCDAIGLNFVNQSILLDENFTDCGIAKFRHSTMRLISSFTVAMCASTPILTAV